MDACILRLILWASILSGFLSGISKANESRSFTLTPNRRLGVNNQEKDVLLKERQVVNQLMCAHWCLRTSSCSSYNLEKESEQNKNNRKCELLSVDEKLRPDLFQEDNGFDFYTSPEVSSMLHVLNVESVFFILYTWFSF